MGEAMKTWSITEARANICNVFDEALNNGAATNRTAR